MRNSVKKSFNTSKSSLKISKLSSVKSKSWVSYKNSNNSRRIWKTPRKNFLKINKEKAKYTRKKSKSIKSKKSYKSGSLNSTLKSSK